MYGNNFMSSDLLDILMAVSLLVGGLQWAAGYRVFKFFLALMGFLVGGALAATVTLMISGDQGAALMAGILGGLLGAGLLMLLYYLGVFLTGALLGGIVISMIAMVDGSIPDTSVVVVMAVLGGVIALFFQKFVIIFVTSFLGANNVISAIIYFAAGRHRHALMDRWLSEDLQFNPAVLVGTLVMGVVGMLIQYKLMSPDSEPQVEEHAVDVKRTWLGRNERLAELKRLADEGLISEAELAEKRQAILRDL